MPLILNGTTGVSGVDGSAGTPSYQGTDTNTGIFYPAADTIAFAEGGAEIARFDSSGNLGIGTSSPATRLNVFSSTTNTARIRVTGTGSTNGNFRGYEFGSSGGFSGGIFQDEGTSAVSFWSTSSSESMRIDSSGNVGIGTSSPGASLHVAGAIAASPTGSGVLAGIQSNFAIIHMNGSASAGGIIDFSESGTDYKGRIQYDNTNNFMGFSTNNTERMRITSGGTLLVGTATSLTGHTFFSGDSNAVFACRNTQTASGQYFQFGHDPNNNFRVLNQSTVGVYLVNGGTSWIALSDENSKTDLNPIANAAEKVSTLRAATGRYKTDHENISRAFLIAQDVQKVLPEAVNENADGSLGLSYTDTIPLLVAAIQEQQAMIEELKQEVAKLKGV